VQQCISAQPYFYQEQEYNNCCDYATEAVFGTPYIQATDTSLSLNVVTTALNVTDFW